MQTQDEIYFDNAATTKVADCAITAALNTMQKDFGNPSSLHKKGTEAKNIIEEARQTISDLLSCKPSEIYFTSGASESNIIAILGTLLPKPHKANKIITRDGYNEIVADNKEKIKQEKEKQIRNLEDKWNKYYIPFNNGKNLLMNSRNANKKIAEKKIKK